MMSSRWTIFFVVFRCDGLCIAFHILCVSFASLSLSEIFPLFAAVLSLQSHTHPFYSPFSGITQLSQCQKKSSSELYGARGGIRGRHTDTLAGCQSIRTNQRPAPLFPHFCARCPSCHNPPNLSWLGTGTKCAGLHTQWLG